MAELLCLQSNGCNTHTAAILGRHGWRRTPLPQPYRPPRGEPSWLSWLHRSHLGKDGCGTAISAIYYGWGTVSAAILRSMAGDNSMAAVRLPRHTHKWLRACRPRPRGTAAIGCHRIITSHAPEDGCLAPAPAPARDPSLPERPCVKSAQNPFRWSFTNVSRPAPAPSILAAPPGCSRVRVAARFW